MDTPTEKNRTDCCCPVSSLGWDWPETALVPAEAAADLSTGSATAGLWTGEATAGLWTGTGLWTGKAAAFWTSESAITSSEATVRTRVGRGGGTTSARWGSWASAGPSRRASALGAACACCPA